ncbi:MULTISPECIES: TetR/AcrR family transcriptional regulator [unclassified Lactobacillus]|uniref:TetR/AcrR family transcriptional regulator n=1 Tax=unclassified Lactobacillus TaxID=2620435 RepID=UPI00223E9346|nr:MULTISPECIES: TetR/AcrR family transcriptional regulator [unclassified Lactobacillus]
MDIRYYNTQLRIQHALIECIKEKPFNTLKNKDIIEKAQVSSRTFYQHFSDKNDVLAKTEIYLVNGLQEALEKDREILRNLQEIPSPEEISKLAEDSFRYTIEYCSKWKDEAKVLLSDNGDLHFLELIRNISETEFIVRFKYLFPEEYQKRKKFGEIPTELMLKIYIGGIVDTIIFWLKNYDIMSPKQVRTILGQVQLMSPVQLVMQK